jgi:CRP/FNR family transcriptional regulator, anaerobic regulatory protein
VAFNRAVRWHGIVECRDCALRGNGLFADLLPGDFTKRRLPIDRLTMEAGATLYHAGEAARALFSIRDGLVKLVRYTPGGEPRIVRLLRAGDVAGMEALVETSQEHTAIALEDTDVCRIPGEIILQLATDTPRLITQLMRRWQNSVHQADDWLTLLSTGSARMRVARLLLLLHDGAAEPVCRLFGREDMAAMLGITTETASRVIAEFRRRRIIAPLAGHRLLIVPAALREIAGN